MSMVAFSGFMFLLSSTGEDLIPLSIVSCKRLYDKS